MERRTVKKKEIKIIRRKASTKIILIKTKEKIIKAKKRIRKN